MFTTTIRARTAAALVFALWAAVLLGPSTPRPVGDGLEYVVMAEKLSRFEPPSMKPSEARDRELAEVTVPAKDHWREFVHFWFYPALVVPLLWLARALHVTPLAAFTLFNVCCLGAVWWVALKHLRWPGALFFLTAPIWWWADKPHTEVFTYSMLSLAILWLPGRPAWSWIALGAASTQNPPIAGVIPLAAAYTWIWRRNTLAASWRGSLLIAIGLALLHPAYYFLRLHRWTALIDTNGSEWPTLDLWGYVVWDPNVGMLFNDPWPIAIGLIGLVALLAGRRGDPIDRPLRAELWLSGAAAVLFLYAFAQTHNVNHGATVSMSRYALWLIPLTVPIWRVLERSSRRVYSIGATLALLSMCWTAVLFRPVLPEGYVKPSGAALAIWSRYPALNNPLPEIFWERLGGSEFATPPAATPGCEKVLLNAGQWPAFCPAAPTPVLCQQPASLCYANRVRGRYVFMPIDVRGSGQPWSFAWLLDRRASD